MFLFAWMARIDDRDGRCLIFRPNQPVFLNFCGLVIDQGAAALINICIAQIEIAMMTA